MFGQSLDPLRRSIPACEYSPIGVCVCEDECLYVEPDMRRILASWPATDRELFLKVVRLIDAGKFRTHNVRERHSVRLSHAEQAGVRALFGRETRGNMGDMAEWAYNEALRFRLDEPDWSDEQEDEEEGWPETTVDLGPVMQTKFDW